MKICVLSRYAFEVFLDQNQISEQNIEKIKNIKIISILDTSGTYSIPFFQQDHSNVITLKFDDITEDGNPSPTNLSKTTKAFDQQHAIKIIKFVHQKNFKQTESLIIHCAAGISRSGTIGMFINDLLKSESYPEFMKRNPRTFVNYHILNILKK